MNQLEYKKIKLKFVLPSGTSRGVLREKVSYILKLTNDYGVTGYGEVSIIDGLSPDNVKLIEGLLKIMKRDLWRGVDLMMKSAELVPALFFGIETARWDIISGGKQQLFKSNFVYGLNGIPINGLVWMNPLNKMQTDAEEKFKSGFKCLKFKIGALNWKDEFNLLKSIRKKYGEKIEIRVDANGAFNSNNVFKVLEELRKLKIHSIEQPIKPGNFNLMKKIVSESGVPIAFDEELIGLRLDQIFMLMGEIRPQYVILKPSLLGGMNKCDLIIEKAEKKKIGWWATSALESNIGLNAIAQWVSTKNTKMPQGLGTGALFKNNIASPLIIKKDQLWMSNAKWKMPF